METKVVSRTGIIDIDYQRDALLSPFSHATLQDRYLVEGESPQDAFARTSITFSDSPEMAQRMYDYVSKLWMSYSTPGLANSKKNTKGLPISCFLNYVDDSIKGLNEHTLESRLLSVAGGGVGAHWSSVRGHTDKSPGVIPFLKTQDADVLAYHQGTTRRGAYAAYMHVSHPDILEFIGIRKATGGDINRKALNIHHGVVISQEFLDAVRHDADWYLVAPETGKVVDKTGARDLYKTLLVTRHQTGEPYIMNEDVVHELQPIAHKEKGLRVHGSNLCAEIMLPTTPERTAVCCLSSLNLEKYDEWKDTNIVADLTRFLDNVLEYFITTSDTKDYWRAINSATKERSIGIGAMGFHALLQKRGIPFESALAISVNRRIFKQIKEQAHEASIKLAVERGTPNDIQGTSDTERRNVHLLAIAPNASSSILVDTSPSIEPWKANAFLQKTASGSFLVKNRYLHKEIAEYYPGKVEETWQSIVIHNGSVQHLVELPEWTRDVFKTAIEINQNWVVQHAVDRQDYVCQSQSVNLFFPPEVEWEYLHKVHWKGMTELKSLYYLRTEALSRAESVGVQIERNVIPIDDECLACEG